MINKDDFKIGYVLAYKRHPKDKVFGKLIESEQLKRGFTKEQSEFTHVEISSGDFHSVNIAPPKARLIDITEAHKGRVVRIYRPKIYDADTSERKRLKVALIYNAIASNNIYDGLGVLKFKIPFLFHLKRAYFCSEGVADSIKVIFQKFFENDASYTFMPSDFTNEEHFTLIKEYQL
jgi:hypothetical protein